MSISDRLDEIEEDIHVAFNLRKSDPALAVVVELWAPDMLAALRAVLDLHKPEGWGDDHLTCSTCWSPAIDGLRLYPCPTVRAVEAALGEVQP